MVSYTIHAPITVEERVIEEMIHFYLFDHHNTFGGDHWKVSEYVGRHTFELMPAFLARGGLARFTISDMHDGSEEEVWFSLTTEKLEAFAKECPNHIWAIAHGDWDDNTAGALVEFILFGKIVYC